MLNAQIVMLIKCLETVRYVIIRFYEKFYTSVMSLYVFIIPLCNAISWETKAEKQWNDAFDELCRYYNLNGSLAISEHNYKQLAASYETEQHHLEQQISEYEESLRNTKAETDNAECFVNLMKEHAGIEELTAAVLHTLIDKILVHEVEVIDGEKVQKIEIYYKFVGNFDIE